MSLYESLDVESDATAHDIKQAYHKLALKYHPDRNKQTGDNHNEETKESQNDYNNQLFLQIQEAWEVLSDPNKRKQYDKQLMQQKYKGNIAISYQVTLAECELIDTEKDDSNNAVAIYEYPCRCGDYFEIDVPASQTNEKQSSLITSCPTCCLNIKLTF